VQQNVINLLSDHQVTYREVVINDVYQLRKLRFSPQLAIDIGAHVGCFAAAVLDRWSNCKVLSVEPNPSNFKSLCDLSKSLPQITAINAAMGRGQVRYCPFSDSDGHVYWSDGCQDLYQNDDDWVAASEETTVPCLTFVQLVSTILPLPKEYIVKIDCEGAECTLFNDEEATKILYGSRHLAVEMHFKPMSWSNAPSDDPLEIVRQDSGRLLDAAEQWTASFAATHNIRISRGTRLWMFTATRK